MNSIKPTSIRFLERAATLGSWLGGAGLLISATFIVVDLTLRKTLGVSLGGADEIAGYVLAIATAWAFPITLLRRAHIRVDVCYSYLPGKAKVILDLFALVCLGVFIGTLTFHVWNVLLDSLHYQSVSNTPLQIRQWIPQSLWVAGYLFFSFVIVALFATSMRMVAKGHWRDAARLIGINSVEEEIVEELQSAPPLATFHSDAAKPATQA